MIDYADWLERARVEWPRVDATADGLSGLRNAILGAWLLMAAAPPNVRDLHRGIEEEALRREAEQAAQEDVLPPLPSSVLSPADRDAHWRVLAVGLRALELRLAALSDGSPIKRGAQCMATFDGLQGYVIDMPPKHREPATGHPFGRRGLARSRLLPLRLGGFRVDVRFPDGASLQADAEAAQVTMGATLFEDVEFEVAEGRDGFRVLDVRTPGQLERIEQALTSADAAACLAHVFPELTVGSRMLEAMKLRLADGSWELRRLGIVVAGSRHVESGGGLFNVATVLDRYGTVVAEHRKLFRYSEGGGPHEAIDLGDTIAVVALSETLVALGICLDFCNQSEASPYPLLDVDYILVPSCGGRSTMRGHLERSGEVMRTLRTRSFVVQQHYDPRPCDGRPPLGYVLARRDTAAPSVDELAMRDTWIVASL